MAVGLRGGLFETGYSFIIGNSATVSVTTPNVQISNGSFQMFDYVYYFPFEGGFNVYITFDKVNGGDYQGLYCELYNRHSSLKATSNTFVGAGRKVWAINIEEGDFLRFYGRAYNVQSGNTRALLLSKIELVCDIVKK